MPGRPACHADPANPWTRPRMATLPALADTVAHPLLVNTVIPTAARRDAREHR